MCGYISIFGKYHTNEKDNKIIYIWNMEYV